MKPLNLVVVAGEGLQGKYFISQLSRQFSLSAVFIEDSHYPPPIINSAEDRADWDWFFLQREAYEQAVFGDQEFIVAEKTPVIKIPHGGLENEDTQLQIQSFSPDLIAIFNTSVLSKNFIELFEGNIVNLHVGLADKYRGSSCNFWPIHNRELGCLGATVHRVSSKIDGGDYYAREVIELAASDGLQSLIAKPLVKGAGLMVQTIRAWQSGSANATPPSSQGRLYLKKDFQPSAIRKVWEMERSGKLRDAILALIKG